MNDTHIESVKYFKDHLSGENVSVIVDFGNGVKTGVPFNLDNRHWAEIKRRVDAGELTIEEAD